MNALAPPDGSLYQVSHITEYLYSEVVSMSFHQALLTPRDTSRQHVSDSRITIDPPAQSSESRDDYFGNHVTHFTVSEDHRRLRVEAASSVTVSRREAPSFPRSPDVSAVREALSVGETDDDLRAFEFAFDSPLVSRSAELAAYAGESLASGRPFLDGVDEIMHRIHAEFRYDPTVTTVSTPVGEVLEGRQGVCQDFAHLMIGALRSQGAAARYVSGYLVPGADIVGAQASHAWVAVYCPGAGWFDFDPTNDTRPAHGHITLAWGRDFSDVSPLRGVMVGGGEHAVSVEVKLSATV